MLRPKVFPVILVLKIQPVSFQLRRKQEVTAFDVTHEFVVMSALVSLGCLSLHNNKEFLASFLGLICQVEAYLVTMWSS